MIRSWYTIKQINQTMVKPIDIFKAEKSDQSEDSVQICLMFNDENDLWWIDIDHLSFNNSCQPEKKKKSHCTIFTINAMCKMDI